MNEKKLALFDLDGTLFDTNEVNYCAYKDALLQKGIELEKDYFAKKCMGKHYKDFLIDLVADRNQIEEIHKLKKDAYKNNLDKARVNRHLFDMIKLMKAEYIVAVVTTASRQNAEDILNYYGYYEMFDHLFTQEDVTKVKPDPQCYEIAMDYYRTEKEDTIIFEDSNVGIAAARMTGASVFVVDSF